MSWRTATGATSTRANVSYPSKSQPSQEAMSALQTDASTARGSAIAIGLPSWLSPFCPWYEGAWGCFAAPTDPDTQGSDVFDLDVLPGADPGVLRDRPDDLF